MDIEERLKNSHYAQAICAVLAYLKQVKNISSNDDFTNILKAITAISAAKEEVMNFYLNKKEKELNQPKPKLLTL